MAVGIAFRAGRGGFRAVRATERRQVGCGRPSTGSGWRWGVAPRLEVERFDRIDSGPVAIALGRDIVASDSRLVVTSRGCVPSGAYENGAEPLAQSRPDKPEGFVMCA